MYFYLIFSLWCLSLHFCNSFSTPTPNNELAASKQIPITVISGFLGSGKTTLLKNLLENKQGIKIAIIVNDVASVNIDSKLVSGGNLADGMVELQNGCACCSLADELLGSVSELVTLSDIRGESDGFDHIVVECSGVADPKGIRSQFQEAVFYNMPIMERCRLDTMITVVDCSVFLKHLRSGKSLNADESPELFYRESEMVPEGPQDEKEDSEWMKGMPSALVQALLADKQETFVDIPTQSDNPVADLLVSQTETADIVLLNKIDLIDNTQDLDNIRQIVGALNPRAKINKCSFGNVPLKEMLAVAGGKGVVEAGVVDDHRDAIQAANEVLDQKIEKLDSTFCTDPNCSDASHTHSHEHEDNPQSVTHDSHIAKCDDLDCTDRSHSHTHAHSHRHLDTLRIGSFVYRARRPFHPGRLVSFLRYLPIIRGLPEMDDAAETQVQLSQAAKKALMGVVRSKGFLWLGDSNLAANYWSHSGSAFELQCLGRWWSTLPRPEWPPEAVSSILADFDDPDHDEDDFHSETVGDRRQEIVFIGPGLLSKEKREAIVSSLNQCLLDDSEWELYKEKRHDGKFLKTAFVNAVPAKMLSY